MFPRTLQFKVSVALALALILAMIVFAVTIVLHQQQLLLHAAENHVNQLSEVITKSTRFAMLQNEPTYVHSILQDVGRQTDIEKVRIVSKSGRIMYSSLTSEIGRLVDRRSDACVSCHASERPLEQVPAGGRSRIYSRPEGGRLFGSMTVIHNDPTCQANCHAHDKATTVLGVLDIVYRLDDVDAAMRSTSLNIAGLSAIFILLVAPVFGFVVNRLVQVPLHDLESGAHAIASGDLDLKIPVRSGDEFGRLAGSFNAMTGALRDSREALRDWAHTLEIKVEERTRELHVAQAEAVRTEKLASVGLLASGIAHELNNPLTGVLTFTSLLRKKLPDGSPDAEDLDLVIRETKRCATIIRRLLDFARDKTPETKYQDLNRIVEETARILERPASLDDVEIELDLDKDLPVVWIDADLIKQVVMNMLANARDAIEKSGRITLRTRRCPQPRSPEPDMAPVPMVEIAVIDTGCGIPPANLKKIFDPFFTSKDVGKGTGLGLSVSHGIVKAHGGSIEVESTLGAGSTFRVYLPINPPEAPAPTEGTKA